MNVKFRHICGLLTLYLGDWAESLDQCLMFVDGGLTTHNMDRDRKGVSLWERDGKGVETTHVSPSFL